ncbi:MAG TPA: class E sortase [Candidatus Saccharimonadales bacterium]|nr:class E sortase [Candidatus Saccharimonadales bacterium]
MKLARINTCLFVATIVVCGYIIVAPLAPMTIFWVERHATHRLAQLTAQLHGPQVADLHTAPVGNRLVVPALLLDMPINEGQTIAALRTGPWRRPGSITPDRGGNTVIAGHRYTYTNPRGVFYYLNKLQIGDEIGIFWQGKRYLYKVTSSEVVPPTDTAIEANTPHPQLTLYTCTPLWNPKDRLVVVAKQEQHV